MCYSLPDLTDVVIMTNEDFPGAFKFNDVMKLGGAAEITEMQNLQAKLQFDDAINIQFTSVSLRKLHV